MDETTARIKSLEFRPPPLPPPPPPVQWQPPHLPPPPHPSTAGIDINVAPGASSSATPPRVDSPMGPGIGGGVLGHPPPRIVHGTPAGFAVPIYTPDTSSSHHPPFPKMEFPKFDGSNPRLWRDQCEVYFEVHAVDETMMKTRFASLNFKGSAATWLQTVKHRGWIGDWSKLL
jgi:hypothetical protein